MKIEFNIDDRILAALAGWRVRFLAGAVVVFGFSLAAAAPGDAITPPYQAGGVLTAAGLNASFGQVTSQIGIVATTLDTKASQIEVDGIDDRVAMLEAALIALQGAPVETPVGTILAFGGDVDKIPDGFLLCDGSEVSRATYAQLFQVIEVGWGDGNDVDTFNLPDLRGRFLRGVDLGAAVDPDGADRTDHDGTVVGGMEAGSQQNDAFQKHRHQIGTNGFEVMVFGAGVWGSGGTAATNAGGTITDAIESTGGPVRHTSETRPVNSAVNYIIRH